MFRGGGPDRRCWPVVLAVAALAIVGGMPFVVGSPPSATVPAVRALATAPPVPYHGNIAVPVPAPTGTADIGSGLALNFHLALNRTNAPWGPGVIRIPASVGLFPVATGALRLPLSAVNFSVNASGSLTGNGSASLVLPATESFNASSNATFSSQGLTVMSSWPRGGVSVGLQWHWTFRPVNRPVVTGPWSSWSWLVPDQLATLSGPAPTVLLIGGTYPYCLTGQVANRSFAVHVAFGASAAPFIAPTVTAPLASGPRFCWNTTFPTVVPQSTGLVHVWEFTPAGYLLYQYPVQFVNGTTDPGGQNVPAASHGWPVWVLPGIAAGAVILLAVDISFLIRSRRNRPPPLPPPPAMGAGGEPPR